MPTGTVASWHIQKTGIWMRSIALHAMQSGNSIDSPYAHSYMDGLLGLIEGCRSGKSDPGETLEHIMIDMVSFQRFLDMRLTVLEKSRIRRSPGDWRGSAPVHMPSRLFRMMALRAALIEPMKMTLALRMHA